MVENKAVEIANRFRQEGIGLIMDDHELSGSFGTRNKSDQDFVSAVWPHDNLSSLRKLFIPKIPRLDLRPHRELLVPYVWHFSLDANRFEKTVFEFAETDRELAQRTNKDQTLTNPYEFLAWFYGKLGNHTKISEIYVWGGHGSSFLANRELTQQTIDIMRESPENTRTVLRGLFGPTNTWMTEDLINDQKRLAIVDSNRKPKELIHSFS